MTHRFLKGWLGLPRGASWALVHDVHGMNVKSFDHLYKESRTLTLSNIRFFSDNRVRHALDTKEERESQWCRKFSSPTFAKGVLNEVVPPTVAVSDVSTIAQGLDVSQQSWSSLELSGVLSPSPLSPPPLPTSPPPPPPGAAPQRHNA